MTFYLLMPWRRRDSHSVQGMIEDGIMSNGALVDSQHRSQERAVWPDGRHIKEQNIFLWVTYKHFGIFRCIRCK